MRPEDERYFASLEAGLDDAFDVAERAKRRGEDPEPEVEIPVAKDMADRVENILGIDGVAERVRDLEGEMSREEAALELVEDFVEGRVGDYETKAGKVEGAVRTAVALLTEGVVAAPIEGIDRVEVNANDDGSEYVAVYYAGPIRSAGGTAQALSVLVADYARSLLDIDEFAPRDDEVERYAEEVALYDSETGLQYSPKDKETKFITEHCPVMLDGEATGNEEVDGFRDLERIETNSPRGGMCLVLAEGIALKAPKIQRYTRNLDEVEWPWLQDLIDGTIGEDDSDDADEAEAADAASDDGDGEVEAVDDEPDGPPRVDASEKFLRDLIAGRPVFGHPSKEGGFRLRYGRARNHGNATAGVHPATMHLLDDFLATGTQIKTELPGKAAGVVPVDSIEGPTVKLANGDVRHIEDPAEALEVRNGVEEILDVGEYLVNYGEFVENNHELAPASYAPEWWVQDIEAAGADVQALRDSPYVDLENPDAEQAIEWATEYDAPLHPAYTYLWHDLDVEHFEVLADAVADADREGDELVLDRTEAVRESLEALLVTHHQDDDALRVDDWLPLARSLGVTESLEKAWDDLSADARDWPNALRAVNEVAPFEVQERAPTRIGNRMGRPEKSESRDLSPAVHTLFPIGEAGGSQRDVGDAARYAPDMADTPGEIPVRLGDRVCPDCGEHTYDARCPDCGEWTDPYYECEDCGVEAEPDESGRVECPRCERELDNVTTQVVDVGDEYRSALQAVGERENAFDQLKGVQGLMSAEKVPEPMEKGVLRAKHGVTAFKDGTVRYDMTDLPVTAVKPSELDVTADHFRELGYTEDVHGDPLEHDDQVVELRVQDVVLSDGAAEHMLKTADFVDDLLTQYYGLDAFYEVEERDDLVGELVFGMAPHTSAAVVGRVIGFTSASVGYAHPYFHAAKRRNCFHPETKVWFEDEDDQWYYERIEALVEDRLDPETAEEDVPRTESGAAHQKSSISEDDFGTLVQELDGDVLVPSVTEDGEETLQRVEAVSKHRAPDHLVEIETKSGRELTVTPDHSMRRWTGDSIERVEARELTASDAVPAPKQIPVEGETATFDLLAEFLDADAIPNDDLMVRGIGESGLKQLLDDATDADSYLKSVAERLDVSQSTVYNWVSRDSIPASVLLELFDRATAIDRTPDDVLLGVRRDTASVSRQFEVDETVGTMLGYYAAEGFTRREVGSFYQTTICTPDDAPRAEIIDVFDDVLNVEAFEENEWKVTVSSRLVATLFSDVLDAGSRAETKRVPNCVMSAPDPVVRAFLAAYFSGDGSASSDRVEIRAHTVSDDLQSDLVAALKRFGIATKVYREERTPKTGAVAEFYDDERSFETWVLKVTSQNAVRFDARVGFHLDRKSETLSNALDRIDTRSQRLLGDGGDVWVDEVVSVETVQSGVEHTYSLTVEETNTLVANDLFTGQCDGDEDCVMLLMDGLVNFSKSFLPDKRGGRMDAPLVMSSRIDPSEIDDEAHNVDIDREYPREFYEATRELADPEDVEDLVTIAEATLETDEEYTGFGHTHDTSNIHLGPELSAYKTLGSMMDKMDAQLELSRKLRAVDETDVAERVIEYHFLPDLIGNLRAFSRQETRCLDCGEKYRRMPLTGDCRECGGRVNLTVHQGSVNKYMDTAIQVAEDYDCREYTKQRLEIMDRRLSSIFENDKNKQSGIADFM
ncbi:DNA polymerase II large subunit [Halobacterium jilantaiense]|uniref:DNA polymerase II large subunit n=1 Tax=Halobacterium jilantaiense TaxID=355548 RepID=A0A1I0PRR2_9EURY|nr:DNA polymerase II large subunit [Halobacterium jilantaiense]SEW17065.1 DNA polymerase II large subunit [Halobacterium jilantaiense]